MGALKPLMRQKLPGVRLKFGTVAWCLLLVMMIYMAISFTVVQSPDRVTASEVRFYGKTKPLQRINEEFLDRTNRELAIEQNEAESNVAQAVEDVAPFNVEKDEPVVKPAPKKQVSHRTKQEVTHVALLKVHKTASSTAQNVFLRFGDARNLTFVLAHTKGESGWLNVISYENSITSTNIVPAPAGKHFDIMCNHVLYNRKSWESVLPKDASYIGIVREPMSRFQSAIKYFSPNFILKLPGSKPIIQYAKDPMKYEPITPRKSQTNNRMALEFGFPENLFPGRELNGSVSDIKKHIAKLDKEFKMIIISERFDESMVLMKRYLNWTTKDILYMDQNVAPKASNTRKLIPDEAKKDIERFLVLDFALYNYAIDKFNKQIKAEGKSFTEEYDQFKKTREDVVKFCKTNTPSMNVPETEWDDSFEVTQHDCKQFTKHEKDLIQKQRMRMYGTLDN